MSEHRPLPQSSRQPAPAVAPDPGRSHRLPVLLLAAGLVSLTATIALPPVPRLIWNASASAPVGLYAVSANAPFRRGDMLFAFAPPPARELAARRHYLPRNVPLLKRVAAMEGDRICARNLEVSVNGRIAAIRHRSDRMGRSLPAWQGCFTLTVDQLFLLMTDSPDSFDGRYFGATETHQIVGRATALWLP